jgi:arylsulfatase A-like enzyme
MMITRRHVLMGLGPAVLAQTRRRDAPVRPNIILLLADGLGARMLGCYGNREVRTPHLDRLGRLGTIFTHHFACTPSGRASRATLLTGRVPAQHRVQDVPAGQPATLDREVMLSDLLGQAGYQCGYFGQWDLGGDQRPAHGYQVTYTHEGTGARYQDPVMYRNGERVEEEGYLSGLLTRRAAEFIDDQPETRPYFAVVSYQNPRPPFGGHPLRYQELYRDAAAERRGYQAGVSALDAQIPVLLGKIREKKQDLNTLVVFTSTSGYLLGGHGLQGDGRASTPPNMFEEAVRTPMIWYWPGKSPAESTRAELISSYDLLPTLAEMAGLAPAPALRLCGRSYRKAVTGRPYEKNEQWDDLVFGHLGNTEMARDARYKLVVRNQGEGPNELFDLRLDANEASNEFDNPLQLGHRERLMSALQSWRKATA